MAWLLSQDVAAQMRLAVKHGWLPTAQQRADHEQKREAEAAVMPLPRGMTVAGDTAEIRIEGILTPKPDLFALFFGGGNATYRDIQAALAAAQSDPAIRRVELAIDSPGGTVAGLFETIAAIESLKASGKPISVRSSNAQSAAYALAAVAGKIRAVSPASMFGSLGVAASFFVDDQIIDIANTESPNKRPDFSTEEGRDVYRQELDALFELFVDAIARGRGMSVAAVKKDFGQGSSFVAAEAARRGMIDAAPRLKVARAEDDKTPDASAASGGAGTRTAKMTTKEEFRAQHPELYAAVLSEGEAIGEAKERKRVSAHLKLADATGAHKVARAAIASGASTMDEEVHAEYLAAGMNRRDSDARQADSDAAAKVADSAEAKTEEKKSLQDIFAADLPPVKKAS
jgi:ClpP class serine protease